MDENKATIIDPNSLVKDASNISVTVNQGASVPHTRAAIPATPTQQILRTQSSHQSAAWPPAQQAAPAQEPDKQRAEKTSTFSMVNVVRRAKHLGKGAMNGLSGISNKLLDVPMLKPLKELKSLATILLVIMIALLLVSFICFFRNAILWGILGLLVDVGVGVGLFFGVQAMPTKAKLLGIAGIAVTGAMLVFCFIRMIMGR